MRVLLICNSLGKGYAATAHLATELVESLAAAGIEVEVLSSNSSLNSDSAVGITLHKCPSILNSSRLQRHLRETLLLFYFCAWACLCRTQYDVVVVMDSPRFCGLAGIIVRLRTRAKCIAWVMDLPFEQALRQKRAHFRGLTRVMSWLCMWILRRMDLVVTLGKCMAQTLGSHGVVSNGIHIIGVWGEDRWAQIQITPREARSRMGFDQRLAIMYSGYAGQWHDFRSLCEALRPFAVENAIQFIFAGTGPGLEEVRRMMSNEGCRNILICDRVGREDLEVFLACGDIHLASLADNMLGTCNPSKVYPPMALGRPIAFLGPGECQAAIDLNRSGAGITAETPAAFTIKLRALIEDESSRLDMGVSARAAYLGEYSRSEAMKAWRELMEQAVHAVSE